MLKKKIWANFQRIIELFTKKIFKMVLKIWSWDPGSGKNLFRIQGSKSTRSRIPDPDPQHCTEATINGLTIACDLLIGRQNRNHAIIDLEDHVDMFLIRIYWSLSLCVSVSTY